MPVNHYDRNISGEGEFRFVKGNAHDAVHFILSCKAEIIGIFFRIALGLAEEHPISRFVEFLFCRTDQTGKEGI